VFFGWNHWRPGSTAFNILGVGPGDMASRDRRLIGGSVEFVDGDDRGAVIARVFDPGEKCTAAPLEDLAAGYSRLKRPIDSTSRV
jgi:hypothetical protein